jgi:ribosomal protein S18 acetylase RimI-like enzyme
MSDDLREALEFLTRADMAGQRTEPTRFGTAVFDDRVPQRYDSNYLLLETIADGTSAEEVAADAGTHGRRMIFVRDDAAADRVLPDFVRLGWRVDRHIVMVHRHAPSRRAPTSVVRDVDAATLRSARERLLSGFPWARPELLEQLFTAKLLLAERLDTRFFAAVVDGEVVAYTDLYLEPPRAQIEEVGTLEEHRGRGYASAVVLRAAEVAREAGAEFVFLVADATDWPQQLYRRLGFDPVGRYVKFIAPTR